MKRVHNTAAALMVCVMLTAAWAAPQPASPRRGGPEPVAVVPVRAIGMGRPPLKVQGARAKLMARRAAEVDAVRNLALKIDPTGRTNAPPFQYVATKYLSDGSVEVTVEARVVSPTKR